MFKSFLHLKYTKYKIRTCLSSYLKSQDNWIYTIRKYADKSDCKPRVRTMKVEECIPPSKQVQPQSHKKSCDGDQMMDKCPKPTLRTHATHYPPNLVLLAGLSVLAVSIYALKVIGFGKMVYRANVDYETDEEE